MPTNVCIDVDLTLVDEDGNLFPGVERGLVKLREAVAMVLEANRELAEEELRERRSFANRSSWPAHEAAGSLRLLSRFVSAQDADAAGARGEGVNGSVASQPRWQPCCVE